MGQPIWMGGFVPPILWVCANSQPTMTGEGPSHTARLIVCEDKDFDWLLDLAAPPFGVLIKPPGGVDNPFILGIVRQMTRRLSEAGCKSSWMVAAGAEIVGLCSYKSPPDDGAVEIGYGIAASRRNRGYASMAVAGIIEYARADGTLNRLTAETSVSNPSSARVLIKSGFSKVGQRDDPDDGLLDIWERKL